VTSNPPSRRITRSARKDLELVRGGGVEGPIDVRNASFYLSRVQLRPSDNPGMRRWRKHLFLVTALIEAEPTDYFQLPRDRTITLGAEIEF
jgi:KUP system potassium uptake protein